MALKLDMEKAYDRLEWNFIFEVMKVMGFSDINIQLICQCITSVTYSIIVNGSPKRLITPTRGLRLGDSIYPFLFIMGTEVMSRLLLGYKAKCMLHGIKAAREAPPISHLLFADDTLIFCRATRRSQQCFRVFEKV